MNSFFDAPEAASFAPSQLGRGRAPRWIWDDREQCLTLWSQAACERYADNMSGGTARGTQAQAKRVGTGGAALRRPWPAVAVKGWEHLKARWLGGTGTGGAGRATDQSLAIVLPLARADAFRKSMEALTRDQWEEVGAAVKQLTRRPVGAALQGCCAMAELGFRLLRFSESRRKLGWPKRIRLWKRRRPGGVVETPDGYRLLAEDLLVCLGSDGPETAWRLAFDEQFPFERRLEMVEATQVHLLELPHVDDAARGTAAGLTERRLRELSWWCARFRFELACAWERREGIRNPEARRVLHESSVAYLTLLKDEPRRRELEDFLREGGSSIEAEVDHVFGLKEAGLGRAQPVGSGVLRTDEAVRRIFFLWYLKRYNLLSAYQLITNPPPRGEVAVTRGFFILSALMLSGSLWAFLGGFGTRFRVQLGDYFFIQVAVQLVSLLGFIVAAPSLSRLALPRALFGTLMAWLTVIGAYAFGLSDDVREHLHQALTGQWYASAMIAVGFMIVAYMFMFNEVRGHVSSKSVAARRSAVSFGIMLFGALFWGLIFSLPLKMLLERKLEVKMKTDQCQLYLTIVGGCAAVVFGILVQLLWDDRSITEPLGEPL